MYDYYAMIIFVLFQGTVTYFPDRNAIIWTIKQFTGSKDYLMRAHFGLPSIAGEEGIIVYLHAFVCIRNVCIYMIIYLFIYLFIYNYYLYTHISIFSLRHIIQYICVYINF